MNVFLLSQDHLDKLLVVDVALGVLLAMDQLLNLFFTHLLSQSSQQMPELHSRDQTITLLVKMLETLNEVVNSVSDGFAGDILEHGQEHLEGDPGILLLAQRW